MMTEYHTTKRIDNTRLIRCAAPSRVRDLWKLCGAGAALASCLLFYAWQHFECIQVTYRVEELKAERAKAAELNQQLHLEVAALRSPMRVDAIARQQLGLTVPVPGQLAPTDGTSDAVLADAREAIQTPRP
jgi:cell division protein FtsL